MGMNKFEDTAVVALSADGDIVALQALRRVVVTGFCLFGANADNTVTFRSGTVTGTIISGVLDVGLALTLPHNPKGWFKTNEGEALFGDIAGTSAALDGFVSYFRV